MQADFQQALADLTAAPDSCLALRADPAWLSGRYTLSSRETRQLLAMVHDAGMAHACTLYRMNRLAPLAINFDATLTALGGALRGLVSAYWGEHRHGHPHFFIESERFGLWLQARVAAGLALDSAARVTLARELAAVQAALASSLLDTTAIA